MINTLYISRKDQIHDIAARLFRQNGYAATSIRQLASQVGIEPASIYSHIRSKEALLRNICFGMAEQFFSKTSEAISRNCNAEENLRSAISAHIGVIITHLDEAAVFFHEWRHLNEEDLNTFRELRHQYENLFLEIIREEINRGKFRRMDEKFITLTLFSAMNWTYEWYKPGKGIETGTIAGNIADIIINGLKN